MIRRVVLNGRFLSQAVTGVQRSARETVRALDELVGSGELNARRWAVEVLAPPDGALDLELSHIPIKRVGRLRGNPWEQLVLPRAARGAVVVSFANTAPLAARRQLVVMHDAGVWAVPGAYTRAFRLWYRLLLPALARRARRVGTVSEFSRSELMRRVGVPAAKLFLVPPSAEHILSVSPDMSVFARASVGTRPYVLAVASRSAHKNLAAVAALAGRAELAGADVLIAGGDTRHVFGSAVSPSAGGARVLGRVTDGELRALYGRAACFVFPSFYEGFGLPPLEAMACGCPAVVANADALSEVCGDAALYCDPRDVASLARQVARLLASPVLRGELGRRGRTRAATFTWTAAARAIAAVLDEVAA